MCDPIGESYVDELAILKGSYDVLIRCSYHSIVPLKAGLNPVT